MTESAESAGGTLTESERRRRVLAARLGVEVPLFSAPMAGVAGGRLAAAVSTAGAFGMIGVGASMTSEEIRAQCAIAAASGRPYGVGLMAWALAESPQRLDAVLSLRPALVSVSFGDLTPWVRRIQDAGVLVATQVADGSEARAAVDAGVDVIVARGAEAGGHGLDRMGTLPLLDAVLDVAGAVPVVAAGGVTSPGALAAVVAAGAAGAWVGTAFLACPEALNTAAARARVVAASGDDTVVTRVFDIAQRIPWPEPYAGRALRNAFTRRWHGNEAALAADLGASEVLASAKANGNYDIAYIYAGQGVGAVTEERPAAQIVADLVNGARDLLGPGWLTSVEALSVGTTVDASATAADQGDDADRS